MEAQLYHDFARLEDSHWWFAGRKAVIAAVLRQFFGLSDGPRRRILDVGCGTGGLMAELLTFGEVIGLEDNPDALTYCRARMGARAQVIEGNLPNGLPPGKFDLVTAFDVLEHLAAPQTALEAIRGALAPNGMFVCTVPAFQFLWSHHDELNHHYRRYDRTALIELLTGCDFQVKYASYFNCLLFLPAAIVRLAQKVRPRRSIAPHEGSAELSQPPEPINAVLRWVFSSEKLWVPRIPLPFGLSVLAVAKPFA